MSNNNAPSSGIGFFGLLGIVFIALKLAGEIDWHWALVTLPLWGGFVISILAVIIVYIVLIMKDN